MKRSTKFITLLLIASMALSVCACDIRRKGVDRIMLDEYDKPEHSVETTIPEPTETEPAPTEPDPTTPEPTTTTAPTGGTTSSTDLTSDYVYVMSLLTLGQKVDAAKTWVESILFSKLGDPVTETSSDKSYTVYSYPCDVKIDGVKYDQVDLYVSTAKNTVYNVAFLTAKMEHDPAADYYKGVTARFKQLISTAPDETEDPGNKYVTHFKAAENIDLSVTLTFNGNDSRLMFNVEDKAKK